MRLLIISEEISNKQAYRSTIYSPPGDVEVEVADLNNPNTFTASVFDYDVSFVHITQPHHHSLGYFRNIPKLARDCQRALDSGRSVICLPGSRSFKPEELRDTGPPVYEWLTSLGVELQENFGEDIRPTASGRSQAIQEYLASVPRYYQIVAKPQIEPARRLAVVGETDIVVACECQVKRGTLVILPPPKLDAVAYPLSMSRIVEVARRYFDRSQRSIPVGDAPEWLDQYRVPRAKEIAEQISDLSAEKGRLDTIAYSLYGTGDQLEASVALLLQDIGLDVTRQAPGANIDFKATHPTLGLGFAIEVTGTKGTIQKDSSKVSQAWQYLNDRAGTAEESDRLIIVANAQCHLDPKGRTREAFSPNVVALLGNNHVLLVTSAQLFDIWKAVYERKIAPEAAVARLHASEGLYQP